MMGCDFQHVYDITKSWTLWHFENRLMYSFTYLVKKYQEVNVLKGKVLKKRCLCRIPFYFLSSAFLSCICLSV